MNRIEKYKNNKVSIITPMYNSQLYIEEMIMSVLNQTYSDWELIIVDDCSTDSSKCIVQNYCELDDRIKLVVKEENTGPAQSRNIGIKVATGRYIAFLDSDDLWKKEKLESQVLMMQREKVAISCTAYEINYMTNSALKYFYVKERITYEDLLKVNYFSCDTVLIDRNLVNTIYFNNFTLHEDYITWLGLMKQNISAIGINKPLAVYRIHSQSRSSNKFKGIIYIWRVYREFEKLGFLQSLKYTLYYSTNGIKKYFL